MNWTPWKCEPKEKFPPSSHFCEILGHSDEKISQCTKFASQKWVVPVTSPNHRDLRPLKLVSDMNLDEAGEVGQRSLGVMSSGLFGQCWWKLKRPECWNMGRKDYTHWGFRWEWELWETGLEAIHITFWQRVSLRSDCVKLTFFYYYLFLVLKKKERKEGKNKHKGGGR